MQCVSATSSAFVSDEQTFSRGVSSHCTGTAGARPAELHTRRCVDAASCRDHRGVAHNAKVEGAPPRAGAVPCAVSGETSIKRLNTKLGNLFPYSALKFLGRDDDEGALLSAPSVCAVPRRRGRRRAARCLRLRTLTRTGKGSARCVSGLGTDTCNPPINLYPWHHLDRVFLVLTFPSPLPTRRSKSSPRRTSV